MTKKPIGKRRLRKLYNFKMKVVERVNSTAGRKSGLLPLLDVPKEPLALRKAHCGALTKFGAPCGVSLLFPNGFCRFHGGA